MEIKFEEEEIGEILSNYVKSLFSTGSNKKVTVQSKYNDYIVTVSDLPVDESE